MADSVGMVVRRWTAELTGATPGGYRIEVMAAGSSVTRRIEVAGDPILKAPR